jgi:CDP-glucose 4,6-dehydratase
LYDFKPEIVFHLAAQPIVRLSYDEPMDTYSTNVMGTVHILEAIRKSSSVRSFVNITTDKVYENREWIWGYRENETLCGFDPYSNSKSCSEMVTSSYRNSFFSDPDSTAISTARSGNVIGGGDFAQDRIIPDCVRAIAAGRELLLRNPFLKNGEPEHGESKVMEDHTRQAFSSSIVRKRKIFSNGVRNGIYSRRLLKP